MNHKDLDMESHDVTWHISILHANKSNSLCVYNHAQKRIFWTFLLFVVVFDDDDDDPSPL